MRIAPLPARVPCSGPTSLGRSYARRQLYDQSRGCVDATASAWTERWIERKRRRDRCGHHPGVACAALCPSVPESEQNKYHFMIVSRRHITEVFATPQQRNGCRTRRDAVGTRCAESAEPRRFQPLATARGTATDQRTGLTRFENQKAQRPQDERDEALILVRDVRTKVLPDENVPRWTVQLVHLALDQRRHAALDRILRAKVRPASCQHASACGFAPHRRAAPCVLCG